MRYEVIQSKLWRNRRTGGSASLFGAVPWVREQDAHEWYIEMTGWTVRNPHTGEVGIGRMPWATKDEATAFADKYPPPRSRMGD
jgi:hypothetical protein